MEAKNSIPIEILPFEVNYNGPAPIKSYFQVEQQSNSADFVSHFRGRKLVGKEITLPENVTAVHAVIGEKTSSSEGKLELQNHYRSIRIWQHDHAPETNQLHECLNWMEIAQAVR